MALTNRQKTEGEAALLLLPSVTKDGRGNWKQILPISVAIGGVSKCQVERHEYETPAGAYGYTDFVLLVKGRDTWIYTSLHVGPETRRDIRLTLWNKVDDDE